MALPDPAAGLATPHAGHHWEWAPEDNHGRRAWRVVAVHESRQCRWRADGIRCVQTSVAKMLRGDPNRVGGRRLSASDWWHYCADHMFGRVVHDGRVWTVRLAPDQETHDADA